jgi:hypothetical protein
MVRLTMSAALIDEMSDTMAPSVVLEEFMAPRRPKTNWFVEVTQEGLNLVAIALEPPHGRAGTGRAADRSDGQSTGD